MNYEQGNDCHFSVPRSAFIVPSSVVHPQRPCWTALLSILLLSSSRLAMPSGRPLAFDRVTLGRLLMNHTVLKFVSILLVLCVLSVGGLAQAQLVEHAGHHAHHQAATHGTVLCSWMCAAGEVLDSAVVTFQAELSPIAFNTFPNSAQSSIKACQTSPSRAPPSFSL